MNRTLKCLMETPLAYETRSFYTVFEQYKSNYVLNKNDITWDDYIYIMEKMIRNNVYGTKCEEKECNLQYQHELTGKCDKYYTYLNKIEND